ncbi:Adaptin ear-binding coat-associated protein 2 [Geranomyces michiganensis]|nr:Adaptin ear-binding coat-associated protein 2 [Geranomyces michiganensis]
MQCLSVIWHLQDIAHHAYNLVFSRTHYCPFSIFLRYKHNSIPPRATTRGYRASDWDVTQHLWSGRLRITASATRATIRLEDANTGDLFAAAPYEPDGTTVEPVADSSRYFVMRIVDPGSGQHAFVGVGFPERGWAFDFNVALQDFATRLNRAKAGSSSPSSARKLPEGPKVDYSLKEGQTISINLGNSATSAKKSARPSPAASDMSLPFLPPPPSAASVKREQPAQSQNPPPLMAQQPAMQQQQAHGAGLGGDWTDFGSFVGGAAMPSTDSQQQGKPMPSASSSSVPSTWTTF